MRLILIQYDWQLFLSEPDKMQARASFHGRDIEFSALRDLTVGRRALSRIDNILYYKRSIVERFFVLGLLFDLYARLAVYY